MIRLMVIEFYENKFEAEKRINFEVYVAESSIMDVILIQWWSNDIPLFFSGV